MMSYGYEVQGENDPFVATVDEAMGQFAAATSTSAFTANIIPLCTSNCPQRPERSSCLCSQCVRSDEDSGVVPRRWVSEDWHRMEEDS